MNKQLDTILHCAKLFFGNTAEIEPCERGNVNTTCYVRHSGETYLIKTESRADIPDFYSGQIERDIEGARLFARHGLPCAKILFHGRNSLNQRYIISTVLKGRMVSDLWADCGEDDKKRIKGGILEIIGAMQNIQAESFGNICGAGSIGRYKTWNEAYTGLIDIALKDCLRFCSLNQEEAETVAAAARANAALYRYSGKPALCHMDLHWYNVMAEKGKITGFIDFGSALYAPCYSDIFRLDGAFLYGNGNFFDVPPLNLERHEAFSADLLNTLDYFVFLSMTGRAGTAKERLLKICTDYLDDRPGPAYRGGKNNTEGSKYERPYKIFEA